MSTGTSGPGWQGLLLVGAALLVLVIGIQQVQGRRAEAAQRAELCRVLALQARSSITVEEPNPRYDPSDRFTIGAREPKTVTKQIDTGYSARQAMKKLGC